MKVGFAVTAVISASQLGTPEAAQEANEAGLRRLDDPTLNPRKAYDLLLDSGRLRRGMGNLVAAASLLERAKAKAIDMFGETSPQAADVMADLGRVQLDRGRFAEAGADCGLAASLKTPGSTRPTPGWLSAIGCLAQAQLGDQKGAEAARTFQAILDAVDGAGTAAAGERMNALEGLGAAARESGDYAGSLRALDAAVGLAEAGTRALGTKKPALSTILYTAGANRAGTKRTQ
ncbi:MAG: hypothetical protein ABI224_16475 [Acetobacteraceae bacterium]